ncbi:MAG: hypothetical protein WCZ89_10170 [Phycisphaerae bacterium]
MEELIMLIGEKAKEILQYVLENKIPASMSYCVEQRWHRRRIFIHHVEDGKIEIMVKPKISLKDLPIEKGHLIGVSFQCELSHSSDRFIFSSEAITVKDDIISMAMPEEIEIVRNTNFIRYEVPQDLDISVDIWHKKMHNGDEPMFTAHILQGWSGRLINLSADGLCAGIDIAKGFNLEKGDYIGFRFIPFPNESPITANACIRNLYMTADEQENRLDLDLVGLEASPEGRMVLRRLCNAIWRYRRLSNYPQLNKSAIRQATISESL